METLPKLRYIPKILENRHRECLEGKRIECVKFLKLTQRDFDEERPEYSNLREPFSGGGQGLLCGLWSLS